ncbi:endonuclease or glycosyl hydrolase, partial [Trifolium medium]|nr:endonuclease or glycosyl hydrolase [Trifolium medium]
MDDAISVEGKGACRFVYLRNRKGGSGVPTLSLAKKDKIGKKALEENANAVIGGCSSDE